MAWYGTSFVFGEAIANSGIFAVSVFPALIFFASTVQVLYYLGTIQWILKKACVIFMAILNVSASEATIVVASVSFFINEKPIMVVPRKKV
jgi:CNT family concentrative nucleoside transporter